MGLLKDVVGYGTHSDRPAASSQGRLYYETDTQTLFRDNGSTWNPLNVGGGGSFSQIDHTELTTTTANISFSSIPNTFRHLELHVVARGDVVSAATKLAMQLNGDTGSNYDRQFIEGYGSAADGQEALAVAAAAIGYVAGTVGPATDVANYTILHIGNYAGTTFRKAWIADSHADIGDTSAAKVTSTFIGDWRSAAAINAILLFPESGNFVAGTVATLYGLA